MADFVSLLGVKGGPAIRPGSNMPTSTLIHLNGKNLLVDAGLGVSRSVCEQGVSLNHIDAIFITHLHSDHYLELGPLIHTAWVSGRTVPIPIYGPQRLKHYWDAFLISMADDIKLRKSPCFKFKLYASSEPIKTLFVLKFSRFPFDKKFLKKLIIFNSLLSTPFKITPLA